MYVGIDIVQGNEMGHRNKMGLQHYTQDMSKIPLKYHKKVLFYTKYTHPTLICRGTDGCMDGRTDGKYLLNIFRVKLLLLGEHGLEGLRISACVRSSSFVWNAKQFGDQHNHLLP